MPVGEIMSVFHDRGYGFIEMDMEQVHFSKGEVRKVRFEDLQPGDRVKFAIRTTNKGPIALNVQKI